MNRELRQALEASPKGRAFLDAQEKEKRDRRSRAKALRRRGRAPGKTRDERRKERNERMAEIRVAAFERSQDAFGHPRCEVCNADGDLHVLDCHHLIGGGMRRHRESAETVIMLCRDCHRAYERADMSTLRAVKEWALRLGYREALHEVEHRISKCEEARRPSVPVRIEVK